MATAGVETVNTPRPTFYGFNEKTTIVFVDGIDEAEIVDKYPHCPCCGNDKECAYVHCCMK